jgi:hypothetical protein
MDPMRRLVISAQRSIDLVAMPHAFWVTGETSATAAPERLLFAAKLAGPCDRVGARR